MELDESTFDGRLTALYFVPSSSGDRDETTAAAAATTTETHGRALLRDLYRTANETEKTLEIVQICYPDKSDERKDYDELTDGVPWHSVPYDHAERRV